MMVVPQPARRALIGTLAVVVALLAIPLTLLPGWLPVTVPTSESPAMTIPQGGEVVRSLPPTPEPDHNPEYVFVLMPDNADRVVAEAAPAIVPPHESAPSAAGLTPAAPNNPPAPTDDSGSIANGNGWGDFLLGAYGLLALALLVRLGLGHVILARRRRASHPAPDWAERVFRELAAGVCPRARLRVSSRAPGPVCFGVFWPRVVVPARLVAAGDASALRCVLAHELGHLGR